MVQWMEKLYAGAIGRLLRAALTTAAGVAVSHYANNQWYISLGPFLQLIGKTLRDKAPGQFDWLPF